MRRKPTVEQQEKAKARRLKMREIARQIGKMSLPEREALVADWPTTIEGHKISLHNACMLAMQGGATVIGGFRQWKKAGRYVRKGAHGMAIWIPLGLPKQGEQAEQGETIHEGSPLRFALATVFDISQTDEMRVDEASGQPLYTESEVLA